MSDQAKQFILAKLRDDFIAFMHKMMQMPGSPMQKQQALLRFDEGHMWMQNAVGSYIAPKVTPAANEVLDVPPEEGDSNQVLIPEEQPVVSPAE